MATVIRAFADAARAQQLHDQLLDAGLSSDRVRLLHGEQGDGSLRSPAVQEEGKEPGDRGVLSSLGHFFVSALGADGPDQDHGPYAEALRRGECIIAVNARTPTEEGLARAILDDGSGAAAPDGESSSG